MVGAIAPDDVVVHAGQRLDLPDEAHEGKL
jgi:hypothetical protein